MKREEGGNIADIAVLCGLVNFPRGLFFWLCSLTPHTLLNTRSTGLLFVAAMSAVSYLAYMYIARL